MKTINIYGTELQVDYHFQKGMRGDRFQPDDPDELEIYEVNHQGEDIRDLLSERVLREVKEKIIEQES